jgi:hypothetical protein
MGKNDDLQLTSVKVNKILFDEFKVASIRSKISLQKLVDRSLYLYLTNEEYKKQIHNQLNTILTGSI